MVPDQVFHESISLDCPELSDESKATTLNQTQNPFEMTVLKHLGSRSTRIGIVALALGAAYAVRQYRKMNAWSFAGRTVVITGRSRGLGFVMAKIFAAEGARVVLWARNPEELGRAQREIEAAGGTVLVVPCDLTQREQIDQAVQRTIAHFGNVDVLVNNAGIIQVGPFEHMTLDDYEQAMACLLYTSPSPRD